MMKEEASVKKDERIDCYKSLELVFLAILYATLTILYTTASTILQFVFVAVISVTVAAAQCRDWLGLKRFSE